MSNVILATDINYGASYGSATQNTAVTPDLLQAGAIGIYGTVETDATTPGNNGKTVLLTRATTGAGLFNTTAGTFNGKFIRMAVGLSNTAPNIKAGPVYTPTIQISGITIVRGAKYVAPVKQVSYVGYNGTSGSLNTGTLINGSEAVVMLTYRKPAVFYPEKESFTAGIRATMTGYDIARQLADQSNNQIEQVVTGEVVSNGVIAAGFTNTATVTQGSLLVTSTAHGVVAGDYVSLAGVTYKVVTAPTTATFTIDAPYAGVSAAIAGATANTGKITTAATEWGVKFTAYDFPYTFEISLSEVITYATITYSVVAVQGNGDYFGTLDMEKKEFPYRGAFDQVYTYMRTPAFMANSAKTYDLYFINFANSGEDKASGKAFSSSLRDITVGFEVQANTANKNQSDFEFIMTKLVGAANITTGF